MFFPSEADVTALMLKASEDFNKWQKDPLLDADLADRSRKLAPMLAHMDAISANSGFSKQLRQLLTRLAFEGDMEMTMKSSKTPGGVSYDIQPVDTSDCLFWVPDQEELERSGITISGVYERIPPEKIQINYGKFVVYSGNLADDDLIAKKCGRKPARSFVKSVTEKRS